MHTVITQNNSETQKLAEDFAKTLQGGEVLCLWGDLGFGKTTFTQGLAKGLGLTGRITSPTFLIMRTYTLTNETTEKPVKMLYHVDLYRVTNEKEIIELGLLDLMQHPEHIVVIEWPEKMGTLLPEKRIDIKFEYIDENRRKIKISTYE